ncbi:hypothetical protein VTJ04DRAFT_4513 [Mycothermus thermophilus]|uniref:uncharacterized protein n=1 Tax=Humicola insolens TaxID=85995 RepID=UPI0037429624
MAGSAVDAMAGSRGQAMDVAGHGPLESSLSPEQLAEFREYGKLVQFRDAILKGLHPRIKPPQTTKPTQPATSNPSPAPSSAVSSTAGPIPSNSGVGTRAVDTSRQVADNARVVEGNKQQPGMSVSVVPGLSTITQDSSSQHRASQSEKPQINPVLLEKSDDLIKAEIQLQRQRVERSLKEELDQQRRPANKSELLQQLPDVDVADAFAKAMSLVQATTSTSTTTAALTATATPVAQSTTDDTAANASASIDSDNDTFYSSRHDTPESVMASRLPDSPADEEMREGSGSPYEPELDLEPSVPPANPPPPKPQLQHQPNLAPTVQPAPAVVVPGLSSISGSDSTTSQSRVTESSVPTQRGTDGAGGELRSRDRGSRSGGVQGGVHGGDQRLLARPTASDSPFVRSHDLSPVAPQPTHPLPAALSTMESQPSTDGRPSVPPPAPAQVTALRNQASGGSSPESSPHSSKPEKKKKKKKRKADRLPGDLQPFIKPEPRSPSPSALQNVRPHKRQRKSQQQDTDAQDEEPRYDQRMPPEQGMQDDRYQPRAVRDERAAGYERPDDYRPRYPDEPVPATSPRYERYERVYYQDYRPPPPPPQPPHGYPDPDPYAGSQVRVARPPPHAVEAPPYDDGAGYYRDAPLPSRMSMRPTSHRGRSPSPIGYERPPPGAVPGPRPAARRIIVDAYGREYLEPVRPATVVREEPVGEPLGPYQRPVPPRAVSRRPEPYDDEPMVYRPPSAAGYATARRVVTQPEYYREPTTGPANPPPPSRVEYIPSRAPEPAPREYISRPASVRPPADPAPPRYESAEPPYGRYGWLPPTVPQATREYFTRGARYYTQTASSYDAPPYDYPHPPPSAAAEYPGPRSASVRPTVAVERYEPPPHREYAPPPPPPGARRVEYASPSGAAYPSAGEDVPPPPPRAYSVAPPTAAAQGERYYARPPPPPPSHYYPPAPQPRQQQQQQGRDDDEVVYVHQAPLVREYR